MKVDFFADEAPVQINKEPKPQQNVFHSGDLIWYFYNVFNTSVWQSLIIQKNSSTFSLVSGLEFLELSLETISDSAEKFNF